MFEAFVADWAWLIWLGLILVFITVEVTTGEFTFLMISVGSVGGLVLSFLDAPWWAQILLAAVLSLLLLFTLRPWLHRRLHRDADPARSNIDALLGISGVVVVAFDDGRGQVKLDNGETWSSRLPTVGPQADELIEGTRVVVTAIEGATAVVTTPVSPARPASA